MGVVGGTGTAGLNRPLNSVVSGSVATPSCQGAAVESHVPDTARSSTIVVTKAGTNPHRLGEKTLRQAGVFPSSRLLKNSRRNCPEKGVTEIK